MTPQPHPVLQAQHIEKSFKDDSESGRLEILTDVNLTIGKSEIIAIIGSSGCGKSTLLHILGGLDNPNNGRVEWSGQSIYDLKSDKLADLRNRNVGFVFQFHHLLPEFTALENVMMPGMIARMDQAEVEGRAAELLEMVGLAERIHHQPGELSGGEQQRVAVARALFMKPRLLLTDELTGNLDLKTGAGIHAVLRELN